MKIASWNVNGIRARIEHVTAWIKARYFSAARNKSNG